MLHGVLLDHGKASYVNRWVRTKKLMSEDSMGTALANPSVGDLVSSGVVGVLGFVKFLTYSVHYIDVATKYF